MRRTSFRRLARFTLAAALLSLSAAGFAAGEPGAKYAGRSLSEALTMLQSDGLKIIFSSDLVTPAMQVRSEPRAAAPRQVLDEILAPHSLAVRSGPGETLLVIRAGGKASAAAAPAFGRVEGRVIDEGDRRALASADVQAVGTKLSVPTFPDGGFHIRRLPAGTYTLEARATGYLPRRIENVSVGGDRPTRVSFELAPLPSSHEDVVVAPSSFSLRRSEPEAKQLLNKAEIDRTPHLGDDFFRVISQLPGSTPTDFTAKINVRGGESNEVLVLCDGQELYNPFHLKDFQSVFTIVDSRAIGGLDFLTGGFPAEYGSRMSAVIDLTTNGPSSRRRSAIGITLISAYVFSEGPFAGDRGHWLFSARRGYLEYLLKLSGEKDVDPSYYDVLGRGQYQIGESTSLFANVLAASDDIRATNSNRPESISSKTSDLYAWAGVRSVLQPTLFAEAIVSGTKLEGRREGGFENPGTTVDVRDVRDSSYFGLTSNWDWGISELQTLKLGGQVKRVAATYDYDSVRRVFPPLSGPPPLTVVDLHLEPRGTDVGIYASDVIRLGRDVTAAVGVRWDRATYAGKGDFSPRLNLVWSPGAGTSVRAAWGLFIQPQQISELQVEDGVSTFFPAQRAEHRVLSLEQVFGRGWSVRLEAYQKKIDRLRPRYESAFSKLLNFPESRFDRFRLAPERADVRGAELLIKHDTGGRFSWWASYVLSKAEDVEQGIRYPRSWDQRHAVNLNLNYRPGEKWNINAAWTYHTGWPDTPILVDATDNHDGTASANISYGRYNSLRFPSYHRLDLRVGRWFPLGRGRVNTFLEVTNAYNHANICCLDDINIRLQSNGPPIVERFYDTWLPRAPSFGLQWEF